jgi:hypothetical protein
MAPDERIDAANVDQLSDGESVELYLGERWIPGAFVRRPDGAYITTQTNMTVRIEIALYLGLRRRPEV